MSLNLLNIIIVLKYNIFINKFIQIKYLIEKLTLITMYGSLYIINFSNSYYIVYFCTTIIIY